jgi:peroxiredoxin
LKVGQRAPDFKLPSAGGGELSLGDFAGRPLLLVFTQSGCGPCHDIVPQLDRIHHRGEVQVLVVNNGEGEEALQWALETKARFPVAGQTQFAVAKRYEVFATPFAFLIDGQGVISSKGIATSAQHLGYVLRGEGNRKRAINAEPGPGPTVEPEPAATSSTKELSHA